MSALRPMYIYFCFYYHTIGAMRLKNRVSGESMVKFALVSFEFKPRSSESRVVLGMNY